MKQRVHVSTDNYFSYPKPAFPVLQRSRKVCKMSYVDTTKEGTSDGNLQAVVFYYSFALYFKLKAFFVKADLKIHDITPFCCCWDFVTKVTAFATLFKLERLLEMIQLLTYICNFSQGFVHRCPGGGELKFLFKRRCCFIGWDLMSLTSTAWE